MDNVFYILDCPAITGNTDGFFKFTKVKPERGKSVECKMCGRRLGALSWKEPHRAKLIGEKPGDICCGTGDEFLVSDRFRTAWLDSGLTGLEIFRTAAHLSLPVGVLENDFKYYVARPKYSYVHLDADSSGLVVHSDVGCNTCKVCRRTRLDRVRIAGDTWDGTHIFYPTGLYGVLLVTEDVKRFVEVGDLSNFCFLHQDDYSEENEY